jgi:hypothetical protein
MKLSQDIIDYINREFLFDYLHYEYPNYIIRKNVDKMDWVNVSRYRKIDFDFIEEFESYLDWNQIFFQHTFDATTIRKIIYLFKDRYGFFDYWYLLLISQDIHLLLFEFRNELNWEHVVVYQQVNFELLKVSYSHFTPHCWNLYCKYQTITKEIAHEFIDELDWRFVSFYQNLDEDFIREFKSRLIKRDLERNYAIDRAIIKRVYN